MRPEKTSKKKYRPFLCSYLIQIKHLICLLFVCIIASCQSTERQSVQPAFYHWQSDFDINSREISYLRSLGVHKLYIRYFDVDWNPSQSDAVAIASLNWGTPIQTWEVIPVVFITNRTLLKLPNDQLESLADRILEKINLLTAKHEDLKIEEIQIDCDWSMQTKNKYFELLRLLKIKSKEELILSATIRLHQVKYFRKTGVPPVDKGMLMFYNIGELEKLETTNSILDITTAKKYLVNFDHYPMTLDVALPVFSWGVLFRDGKMIKLINNLKAKDLLNDQRFLKIKENQFELLKSTYLQGYYLYQGDIIKTESVTYEVLKQSADLLANQIENKNLVVTFYHLDTTTINQYPYEQLQEIYQRFKIR